MPKERIRITANKVTTVYQRPPQQCYNNTNHHQQQQHVTETDGVFDDDKSQSQSPRDATEQQTLSELLSLESHCNQLATDNSTNLIVNYLPQTMCQDDLKTLFSTIGQLDSCKLVRDKNTGHSLGYGFVKYRTTTAAEKAILSLNGLRVQNKILKVSLARPSCDNIKGANLYVSGLPRHVTSQELINMFSACGQIITARVLTDAVTGQTKGVGFIRFNLKSEAETAIRLLSGTVPLGAIEPITVKFANQPTICKASLNTTTTTLVSQLIGTVPPTQVTSPVATVNTVPSNFRCSPFDQMLPSHPCGAILPLASHHLMTPSPPAAAAAMSGPFTLCISNLPVDTDDSLLWQIFQPFGAVISAHNVCDPSTNKSKGVGLVTMFNYNEAVTAAVRLNGQLIGDHTLQVTLLNGPQFTANNCYMSAVVPSASGLVLQSTGGLVPAEMLSQTVYTGHLAPPYGLIQLPIM